MPISIAANELLPLVLSGFAAALLVPFTYRRIGRFLGWVVALLPLGIFITLATLLPQLGAGQTFAADVPWVPSLGLNFTFRADGLSVLMGMIISGIGTLIMIYGGGYLAGDRQIGRFFTIVLVFMAAMLGVVFSDNILLLFGFWELTSISSYLLIGFKHEYESSRLAARQALLVTGGGGLALLAGLVLLSIAGGSMELTELMAQGEAIRAHALYLPALALILLGAFTKSAQFPFHFWLPNAMAAPTPVSAYLHSATMVKAGVYLLARLHPLLGGTEAWFVSVTGVGLATAVLGAWLSWQQTDLKRILAYSTVSALGTLTMLLGIGSKLAAETAVLFLLVHALYKGGLFMAAGAIDHETGTRDVRRLGGLARLMPLTLLGVLPAALSMAGIPPLLGFISKELMYETTLAAASAPALLTTLTLITNLLMVTAAAIVLIVPFFGPVSADTAHPHHDAPLSMWLGPALLGGLALAFGLFSKSALVSAWIVGPATTAVYGKEADIELGLFHGWTTMLLLSAITITLGLALFALHRRLRAGVQRVDTAVARFGPEQWYEKGLDGLLRFAGWSTRFIQNGYLRYYILFVMGATVLLVGGTLLGLEAFTVRTSFTPLSPYAVMLMLAIIAGAVIVVTARTRLFAVAGLGTVGYGIAMLYVLYSAPDLAMTQFSVETLTVILFVLVLYRLPRFETISSRTARIRDTIVALLVGGMMTLFVLAAHRVTVTSQLSRFFVENSYEMANGRNIVNVILVDFRGADTMVEITVLAVAAIGVYSLMRSRANGSRATDARADGRQQKE